MSTSTVHAVSMDLFVPWGYEEGTEMKQSWEGWGEGKYFHFWGWIWSIGFPDSIWFQNYRESGELSPFLLFDSKTTSWQNAMCF